MISLLLFFSVKTHFQTSRDPDRRHLARHEPTAGIQTVSDVPPIHDFVSSRAQIVKHRKRSITGLSICVPLHVPDLKVFELKK